MSNMCHECEATVIGQCQICGQAIKDSRAAQDLAIWWEAYRAAIPPASNEDKAKNIADCALAAYNAKAAELAGKRCK